MALTNALSLVDCAPIEVSLVTPFVVAFELPRVSFDDSQYWRAPSVQVQLSAKCQSFWVNSEELFCSDSFYVRVWVACEIGFR